MTQRNRIKMEVEALEDRITPAALSGCFGSKLASLQATLQAKASSLQSARLRLETQCVDLRNLLQSKISSLPSHSNGNSQTHEKICAALDAAYAKLVSIHAPQWALNKVACLQAKFGCTSSA